MEDSKSGRWWLYERAAGSWCWECHVLSGAMIVSSPDPFKSRADCVANAQDHGFQPSHQYWARRARYGQGSKSGGPRH
jgi:hypothetical protein